MVKVKIKVSRSVAAISLMLLSSLPTTVLSGSLYTIEKYSINSGGLVSSGSNFSLTGTIAQSNASTAASSANFSLKGGFWAGGSNDVIFINGFESI